jgi:hypothetical protein
MKLSTIIIIFLLVGAFFTVRAYNIDLKNPQDRESFVGKFWLWLKQVGRNTVDVTSYVVKQAWLPSNGTTANVSNSTKE